MFFFHGHTGSCLVLGMLIRRRLIDACYSTTKTRVIYKFIMFANMFLTVDLLLFFVYFLIIILYNCKLNIRQTFQIKIEWKRIAISRFAFSFSYDLKSNQCTYRFSVGRKIVNKYHEYTETVTVLPYKLQGN